MAEWSRREQTKVTVEFVVPTTYGYACWVEVMKAIRAAHIELWDSGVVERDKDAADDMIRFRPGDESIVVFYEVSATSNDG